MTNISTTSDRVSFPPSIAPARMRSDALNVPGGGTRNIGELVADYERDPRSENMSFGVWLAISPDVTLDEFRTGLAEGGDVDVNGRCSAADVGSALYHLAQSEQDLRKARALLDHVPGQDWGEAADINLRSGPKGLTPLEVAVQSDNLEMVRLLCERTDLKPDAANEFGATALHTAVVRNRHDVLAVMLKTGRFDIYATDIMGCTPLQLARHPSRERILHLFEAQEAAVTSVEKKGCSAQPSIACCRQRYRVSRRHRLTCYPHCVNSRWNTAPLDQGQ